MVHMQTRPNCNKNNVKRSHVLVHKSILAGGFRILSERRSGAELSAMGSGGNGNSSGLTVTVSLHSCSDWLHGMAVVDD